MKISPRFQGIQSRYFPIDTHICKARIRLETAISDAQQTQAVFTFTYEACEKFTYIVKEVNIAKELIGMYAVYNLLVDGRVQYSQTVNRLRTKLAPQHTKHRTLLIFVKSRGVEFYRT